MKLKISVGLTILIVGLSNIYLCISLVNLKKSVKEISENELETISITSKIGNDIVDLFERTDKLSSDIDRKSDDLNEKISAIQFFKSNKQRYEISGNRFVLNYCCRSSKNGIAYFGYDLLVENPAGSGKYDDFVTTSYISFNSADIIKTINISRVGISQIYKIVIDSNFRHTEGVIYPASNSDNYYFRLYDLQDDSQDFFVSIIESVPDYKFLVRHQAQSAETDGEYILKQAGNGYEREIVKDINITTRK